MRSVFLSTALIWAPQADAGELDERTEALSNQLRGVVCQNQTIADSTAPLALQLKAEVRQQLADFLVQRYGDFVLYRPPFGLITWMLWGGPAVLLAAGLALLFNTVRRAANLTDEESDA